MLKRGHINAGDRWVEAVDDNSVDLSDESEMKARLLEELESMLDADVRVSTYYANQRLQVTVEPVGFKEELESRIPDVTVVPYSDIKFTLTDQ